VTKRITLFRIVKLCNLVDRYNLLPPSFICSEDCGSTFFLNVRICLYDIQLHVPQEITLLS